MALHKLLVAVQGSFVRVTVPGMGRHGAENRLPAAARLHFADDIVFIMPTIVQPEGVLANFDFYVERFDYNRMLRLRCTSETHQILGTHSHSTE